MNVGVDTPLDRRASSGASSCPENRVRFKGTANLSSPVACAQCHAVPATADAAGHLDPGGIAEVAFGSLANGAGVVTPAWDRNATKACSNVYCHGATLSGGTETSPAWTVVDGSQVQCGTCHGNPPPAPHPATSPCSACHPTMNADGTFKDKSKHVDGHLDVISMACNSCHGNAAVTAPADKDKAPPLDTHGVPATTSVTVGAHQSHLNPADGLAMPVACGECHVVPATVGDAGHIDAGGIATVTFGPLAAFNGATPAWDRTTTKACAGSYCHGATLNAGGTLTAPVWTTVDGSQDKCGTCHAAPPPWPHAVATLTQCAACHTATMNANGTIKDPTKHINGTLEVSASLACNNCHGNPAAVAPLAEKDEAPPRDTHGLSTTANLAVGAHQNHLAGPSNLAAPIACTECHAVPTSWSQAGHMDGVAGGDVKFGTLATTAASVATWTQGTGTCTNVYCHGAKQTGGTDTTPIWNKVDGTQDACGTCHGAPPTANNHPASSLCGYCHAQTCNVNCVNGGAGSFKDKTKHIDGTVQVVAQACNSCHGNAAGNPAAPESEAPPVDTHGVSATSSVTVGAHQSHLYPTNGVAQPVACGECHVVPAKVDAGSHLSLDGIAEVTFGALSKTGGLVPTWDRTTTKKCANTYCHGAGLNAGGTATAPVWTTVDGSQQKCDSCHGNPPAAPHPQSKWCGDCHTQTANPDGTIKDPTKHIDGTVEVVGQACNSCHGNASVTTPADKDEAPPVDTHGVSATTSVTVGAHQSHLTAAANVSAPVACSECHPVPATVDAATHLDANGIADVTFGTLATGNGVTTPTWDRTGSKGCNNVYCHGATLNAGGTDVTPTWTQVNGTQAACGTCHANPPTTATHPKSTLCGGCHTATCNLDCVNGGAGSFKDRTKHINGTVEVVSQACNSCHGNPAIATPADKDKAPPVDTHGSSATTGVTVGAHQSHLNPTNGLAAATACTECHAVPATVDAAGHLDAGGIADVLFGSLSKTGGLIPAWDRTTTKKCTNTYCHGAGLNAGGSLPSPVWTTATGSQLACGTCHSSPPPWPHPVETLSQCANCHTLTMKADGTIKDPTKHVNGTLDVASAISCNTCHGNAAASPVTEKDKAPPRDTYGQSAATGMTVGAHQAHLNPTNGLAAAVACTECHKVPTAWDDAGHMDGTAGGDVSFGTLSKTGNTNPTWTQSNGVCANTYCHGATLIPGGKVTAPVWNVGGGTQMACDSCHGNPPASPHPASSACSACHTVTMNADGTVKDPTKHINGTVDVVSMACNSCHGNAAASPVTEHDKAPPLDTAGQSATTRMTVGAHQSHLAPTDGLASPVACSECHVVPASEVAPGHLEGVVGGDVAFGLLARTGGLAPTWSQATGVCTNVYCHGAKQTSGTDTTPVWNVVNGTQKACGTCHGNPPAWPHPVATGAQCVLCHADTMNGNGTVKDPTKHVDGVVEVSSLTCHSCHGSTTSDAPPVDTYGRSAATYLTVGAHQHHLAAQSAISAPVACSECHAAVTNWDQTGHMDGAAGGDVAFGTLAKTGSLAPAWNSATGVCANVYCHGAKQTGGAETTPTWNVVDGTQDACGSCHGNPPTAGGHPNSTLCGVCHTQTMNVNGTFKDVTKHIDGTVQVVGQACNACHGNAAGNAALDKDRAPPVDTHGVAATSSVTVGAHQAHLNPANGMAVPTACNECHVVPATVDAATHLSLDGIAEVAFGTLAKTGAVAPTWDRTITKKCANTYCHGATLGGGTAKAPVWTTVDGSQMQCTSCHGAPPPSPHPVSTLTQCVSCHPDTVNADGTIKDATKHVNGVLDVANMACNGCHGNASASPITPKDEAPPQDTHGLTATTSLTVGAHQSHLAAPANFSAPIDCTECHVVPASIGEAGHMDGVVGGDVTFGTLAKTSGSTAIWTQGTGTCTNVYCHGAKQTGGSDTTPTWNVVNGTQAACGTCHGAPPTANAHPASTLCAYCHTVTCNLDCVNGGAGSFKDKTKHINGTVDVVSQACNSCHGNSAITTPADKDKAPPVDTHGASATTSVTVGAHQSHLNPTNGLAVATACTECHTVPATVDATGHLDAGGIAEVLFGSLAKTGGLTPAWDRTTTKKCTNTYCHGANLNAGGSLTSPVWTTVDGSQMVCGTCHAAPPPWPHPVETLSQCANCHTVTMKADGTIKDPTKHVNGALDVAAAISCNTCHGNATASPVAEKDEAPPRDTYGQSVGTSMTVGAHQAHLTGASNLSSPVACLECHKVPTAWSDAGHMDGTTGGDVAFGTLSKTGGSNPAWTQASGTCTNVYCHGAQQTGGTDTMPLWNVVNGTQDACGTCHGKPPTANNHPNSTYCGYCHTQACNTDCVNGGAGSFKDKTKHIDGTVQVVGQQCNSCHGNAAASPVTDKDKAPPTDTHGVSATTSVTVGAHQAHLLGSSNISNPIACTECHVVPATVDAAGHLDANGIADLAWGALTKTGGVTPAWDRTTAKCTNTYCHGAKQTGGTLTAPVWTTVDGMQDACGTCHGNPPPWPHPAATQTTCVNCHAATMKADGTFLDKTKHVNGTVEVSATIACNVCHGNAAGVATNGPDQAPPVDTHGLSPRTSMTVGAHQPHLLGSSNLSAPIACSECHTLWTAWSQAGHMDGAAGGDVTFGTLAKTGSVTPTWTSSTGNCATVYCHGATLSGGADATPTWNTTTPPQDACGNCHGNPPTANGHPNNTYCGYCHTQTCNINCVNGGVGSFKDKTKHVNGIVEVSGQACNSCHGNAGGIASNPPDQAPPLDTTGGALTSLTSVGAHQAHLLGASNISSVIACAECHVVPATVAAAGHLDGVANAEVAFGTLTKTGSLVPTWTRTTGVCASTYCHGASLTLAGGTNKVPVWTTVNGTQDACGTCHASATTSMTRPHPVGVSGSTCATCHGTTMTNGTTFKDKTKHVNGIVEIAAPSGSLACNGVCHGLTTGTSPANQAPPNDTQGLSATTNKSVGDHALHLAIGNISNAMPCNECHAVPTAVPDAATPAHLNKLVDVNFTIGVRAKKTAGVYTASGPTCATVYCHGGWPSSGATGTWNWTNTTAIAATCTTATCHGLSPSTGQHQNSNHRSRACGVCHNGVANTTTPNGITTAGKALHIDGAATVAFSGGGTWNSTNRTCTPSCHGNENWGTKVLP